MVKAFPVPLKPRHGRMAEPFFAQPSIYFPRNLKENYIVS